MRIRELFELAVVRVGCERKVCCLEFGGLVLDGMGWDGIVMVSKHYIKIY